VHADVEEAALWLGRASRSNSEQRTDARSEK
jgi:hypothetical protein